MPPPEQETRHAEPLRQVLVLDNHSSNSASRPGATLLKIAECPGNLSVTRFLSGNRKDGYATDAPERTELNPAGVRRPSSSGCIHRSEGPVAG